jgi:hypothetical protein
MEKGSDFDEWLEPNRENCKKKRPRCGGAASKTKPRRNNNEEFAMTNLPPKQDCDGNHELWCPQKRGHFGRFSTFAKFTSSQPLLFENLANLLGFREWSHVPTYRPVAKTATLATWSLSGEGARRHG